MASEVVWGQHPSEVAAQQRLASQHIGIDAALEMLAQLGDHHPFTARLRSLVITPQIRIQRGNITMAADKLAAMSWQEQQHMAFEVVWGQNSQRLQHSSGLPVSTSAKMPLEK